MEELQQFGSLTVAHRTGGAPVELLRSKDEVVFLAFDNRIRRLVELHVLRGGDELDAALKQSALERARQASEIRGHAFMRILEVGEDQGLVYYISNLNDGEYAEEYVRRRGALSASTALAMVYSLLDDLLGLQGQRWLVSRMRLDRVLVTTLEDTFLQLRVFDYGLSQVDEEDPEPGCRRLVVETSRLLFLLLTGQQHEGENPDRIPILTQLPMSLRIAMRTALTDPDNAPASIERLRDDVREAFSALASGIQARNLRKQLVTNGPLMPLSQLQDVLLEDVPVENILGTRFSVEDSDQTRRYPFSIPAINVKAEQPVTVHLLPPSRIVEKTRYEAVPLQMWRFNPDRHPNILRSLSLWESPDWTFLTEEREPGFALSRLMAERVTLNTAEVLVLMRQVRAGLEQAVECGVQRVDLHPSNILLRVGKSGPLLARELERLMQKRLDAWPPFMVKLRPHMTMRSLYEPLLVDADVVESQQMEEHLQNRDFRHRAFVTLAAYLLSGESQSGGVPQFADTVPDAAAIYVRECLELARRAGRAPNPAEFLQTFESLLTAPAVDLATRLRGSSSVALEEMESAGSVSDFEDEWSGDAADELEDDEVISPVKRGMKGHQFNPLSQQKSTFPWGVAAAAAVVLIVGVTWMLMGGSSAKSELAAAMAPSVAEGPGVPAPVPAPVQDKTEKTAHEGSNVADKADKTDEADKSHIAKKAGESKAMLVMAKAPVPNPARINPPAPPPPPAPAEVVTVAPATAVNEAEESAAMPAPAPQPPPAPAPVPAEVVTVAPATAVSEAEESAAMPAPAPQPPPAPAEVVTVAPATAVDEEPAPAPPKVNAPEPRKPAPPPAVASKPPAPVVEPAPEAPAASPPAVTPAAEDPVTIRRAILPSQEEIDRMKQGHVQNHTDKVPSVSTASPLPSPQGSIRR